MSKHSSGSEIPYSSYDLSSGVEFCIQKKGAGETAWFLDWFLDEPKNQMSLQIPKNEWRIAMG